mmetsp:Transcript_48238/g.134963  ORF Transcript_48238/g.134963 Transcript_48238/m.134963 type:complete len:88 (-) Transcript_48238:1585-1848(-)
MCVIGRCEVSKKEQRAAQRAGTPPRRRVLRSAPFIGALSSAYLSYTFACKTKRICELSQIFVLGREAAQKEVFLGEPALVELTGPPP